MVAHFAPPRRSRSAETNIPKNIARHLHENNRYLVELRLPTGGVFCDIWMAVHSMAPSGPVHGREMRKFILRCCLPVLSGWKAVSG